MIKDLNKEVIKIISKVIAIKPDRITPDSDLFRDLGADSLKAIEIVAAIEKKYKLKLEIKRIAKIKTPGQIINLIEDAFKK
ncbi:MAG: acyl carrier protein [Candidatus Omnitrophota bacterium]|jgi:acyl carrier protein|nr:MAG: acyl carrier protein [Candidatus Omnitrophota bacterium]